MDVRPATIVCAFPALSHISPHSPRLRHMKIIEDGQVDTNKMANVMGRGRGGKITEEFVSKRLIHVVFGQRNIPRESECE